MNVPFLESDATLRQNERIAAVLGANDIATEIVTNEWNEPLAVVARDVLDPRTILGSVGLHNLKMSAESGALSDTDSDLRYAVLDTLPIAGKSESLVLPASFLHVIDLAVQASLEDPEMLATDLYNLPIEANDSGSRSWLDTHIDYSASQESEIESRPFSGLNFNLVRGGTGTAVFGMVRSFADVRAIGAANHQDSIARKLGAPFSEPVELRSGDVAIFQAGPHRKLNRLPVPHNFLTTGSETRYSELYSPNGYAPAATVLPIRQRIARGFHLEALGYAA